MFDNSDSFVQVWLTMNRTQQLRLAAETGVSLPSIRKWARDPDSVQRAIRYALASGCRVLGIDPPAKPEPLAS